MLGDVRLDEKQLSGHLRRAVEQSERSLHSTDAASRQKRVGIRQDHRVPLAYQNARCGPHHYRSVGVVLAFGGDEADPHSEDLRELIAHPSTPRPVCRIRAEPHVTHGPGSSVYPQRVQTRGPSRPCETSGRSQFGQIFIVPQRLQETAVA